MPPSGERYDSDTFKEWHARWQTRRGKYAPLEASLDLMRANNPVVIPRNHKVEQALEAANSGDL